MQDLENLALLLDSLPRVGDAVVEVEDLHARVTGAHVLEVTPNRVVPLLQGSLRLFQILREESNVAGCTHSDLHVSLRRRSVVRVPSTSSRSGSQCSRSLRNKSVWSTRNLFVDVEIGSASSSGSSFLRCAAPLLSMNRKMARFAGSCLQSCHELVQHHRLSDCCRELHSRTKCRLHRHLALRITF